MTDPRPTPPASHIRTAVTTSNAPLHSGSGDIIQLVQEAAARRRTARTYDERAERRLAERFVEPDGFARARTALADDRLVLLRGGPGTGRLACAIMLLSEFRVDGGAPIRVLDPRDAAQEDDLILPEDLASSARLLLDLSGQDDPAPSLRLLDGLISEMRAQQATVVGVLPAAWVRDHVRAATVDVGRPDGAEVLRRHLTAAGLFDDPAPDLDPGLIDFASRERMAEIERLARLVAEARSDEPTGSFARWAKAALAATTQDGEATRVLRAEPDGRMRTLAFAASMFEGCSDGTVLEAERRLLDAVALPAGEEHELVRTDLGHRLDALGARVRNREVRFGGLRGDAVREFFWSQFPTMREAFHRWTVDSAGLGVRAGLGSELVERYTRSALKVGRPDLVADAVRRWSPRDRQPALAAAALENGLTDTEHGAYFRSRCYDWATTVALPVDLAGLVVSACLGVMAQRFPGQAIVRLHHLTRHRDPKVAAAAREGLTAVLEDDFALRRFVVRVSDPSRIDRIPDLRLFLAVVDPDRLVAGMPEILRGRVTTCWTAVSRRLSTAEYEPSVSRWLTAQSGRPYDDALVRVLVHGTDRRGLAALHGITHRWLTEPVTDPEGHRRIVARRMLAEIARARRTPDTADTEKDDGSR